VAEVERVRQEDPVVNAHYAVFENSKLRMTEAAGPKEVYVSYRIGNNVYWTRNRLRLAAGELLITDGEHAARARCGNRVADTPQQPVAEAEEPTAALDAAELPPPRQPASPQPSALVPDVFPPTPLIAMAQPLPAIPDTPSPSAGLADSPFRPFSFLGVIGSGMGVAVGIGAEAAAGANVMFAPTVPPGNSDPSGPVLPLPLLGTGVVASFFPDWWHPFLSEIFSFTPPVGPDVTTSSAVVLPPELWYPWTIPTIITTPDVAVGGGLPQTLEKPGMDPPPPIPPLPDVLATPPDAVPEPGTAVQLLTALLLAVTAGILRRR